MEVSCPALYFAAAEASSWWICSECFPREATLRLSACPLTRLLGLAHPHSCILSRPTWQQANLSQQFSPIAPQTSEALFARAFCLQCRIRIYPRWRRLSHVHGDLLHNGDTVASFLGSPSHLISFFKHLVPSDTGSCRTLRSSGARGNGALPDGHLHWLSGSLLKAPRAGLLCSLSSVYASFPSCVSTHDPV